VRLTRTIWLTGVVFAALALGLVPLAPCGGEAGAGVGPWLAQAQDQGFRVVSGVVLDQNNGAVPGATVFLKNLKTKSIRSFTSIADGSYQFVQVNMQVDYELWAEKGTKKSAVRTVSTWDTRTKFVADLKLK
jgi:Carboxypeptidase regulatory-like domain